MSHSLCRRLLMIGLGILMIIAFWLPWLRLYQSELIHNTSFLNGLAIIKAFNAYSGSSLRLPMFTGIVNGFYALPVTGAGIVLTALINKKWLCIVFGLILSGIVNVFWVLTYFALTQNMILTAIFDPLAELGIGFFMICPLTLFSIMVSLYHLDRGQWAK